MLPPVVPIFPDGPRDPNNCSGPPVRAGLCGQLFNARLPPLERVVIHARPYTGQCVVAYRCRAVLRFGPAGADLIAGQVYAIAIGVAIGLLRVGHDCIVTMRAAKLADTGADVLGAGAC